MLNNSKFGFYIRERGWGRGEGGEIEREVMLNDAVDLLLQRERERAVMMLLHDRERCLRTERQ